MSEEEIALETLKEVASDDFDTLGDDISPKMAQNILNLIEKQQKEIEELKSITKNFNAFNGAIGGKIIIADDKYFNNGYFKNNYIAKQKIREKIKELDTLYNANVEAIPTYELFYFVQSYIDKVKNILKELLEE